MPRELVGFDNTGADEIEKMGVAGVIGAINRAGDNVGGLEIVGGFRVHLLDLDGFRDVVKLGVGG